MFATLASFEIPSGLALGDTPISDVEISAADFSKATFSAGFDELLLE